MAELPTPTISRILEDGTLIELVYDAASGITALAQAAADQAPTLHDRIEVSSGEVLIPYSASNPLIASGCVLLPSAVAPTEPKAALVEDIKAFLHRHVDLSPLFEEIATHYVLFSWVHDAFNDAPVLRLRGDFGSGKTRALLAIGSLCHKAFFASGASTVSPIFHILDAFQGTLVLDEADFRLSDATADLVKILNNGTTRGLPVLRTMTNRHRELHPSAFRVFGPKLIAMRGHFGDDALESRLLTEDMGVRPLRADIALSTPLELATEALALRNRLLAWRFAERHQMSIDPSRAVPSLSSRGNQMALSLLSLIDDPELRAAIGLRLAADEGRALARRAMRPEAAMVGVLEQLCQSTASPNIPVASVAAAYNQDSAIPLPIKSVGHVVRTQLGLQTRKSAGVYVIPAEERTKIAELAARFRPTGESHSDPVGLVAREARVK